MLWQQMQSFFKSWFIYPGLETHLILIAIGVALAFGAIWLVCHWPPLFKRHWLWAVGIFSAFFTLLAVVYVQIPLQYYSGQALSHFWDNGTLMDWLLLTGLPAILLSGLVQEGAKMVPMVAWWWRSGNSISPKMGLAIGAIAGAGFGIFEAFWGNATILGSGWTFDMIGQYGFTGITPFWERFFTVALHTSASALAGYGLAKGKGWQFYLIAAGLHALINYGVLLFYKQHLTVNQLEIWVAVVAMLATAWALWLRWRRGEEEEEELVQPPAQPMEPAEPVN